MMAEDGEFQNYSIKNILLLLMRAMNRPDLSTYKELILKHLKKNNDYLAVILIVLYIYWLYINS